MSFIPVNEPLLNGNEKKYIDNCIDTGWISSEGPYVKEFEDKFSSRVGRKFGIAVCNGTAALEAAVIAAGIKKGDEVILPSFTIISCASSIIRAGGIPVLVDSENFTWNMNVNQVRQKITKKTRLEHFVFVILRAFVSLCYSVSHAKGGICVQELRCRGRVRTRERHPHDRP